LEFDGIIGELSTAINGNFFTGILKGDGNFPLKKQDFFDDKGEIEASLKIGFDGRYYRELNGSPIQKIAEFVGILIFSKENQEVAYGVLLEKHPDVQSWFNDTARALGYVAGSAALVTAVLIVVVAALDNLIPVGWAVDSLELAAILGLVKFALRQFGLSS
jgi:hypothetical protein